MKKVNNILNIIRIRQWVKNLFIFIPAFFNGKLFNGDEFYRLTLAFLAFSMIAGAVYILNDLLDIERDKLHPKKKKRPLAAGVLSKRTAIILMIGCFSIGSLLAYSLSVNFLWILFFYLIINILYSIKLKHISLIDIGIIAIGFLIRIFAGGIIADVPISDWLIIMIFLLSVLMALAKRRDDVLIQEKSGIVLRVSMSGYNQAFIDAGIIFSASIILVSYIMYTISEEVTRRIGSHYVYVTSFWVLFGVLRYLQIIFVNQKSGSPTRILLRDRFIQTCILLWLFTFYVLIYK